MVHTVLFDTDGIVVRREMYFSERFSQEFGVPVEKVLPFFKNEFQLCLAGKADLKQELEKYLLQWNWKKGVDDLLTYWFEHEKTVNKDILDSVQDLKTHGIRCYLHTNNEKYRLTYLLEEVGLKELFDGVFASAELGFLKPQLEFWSSVYHQLGSPDKSEILVWDDDEENVISAREFGFQAELYSSFEEYQKMMKSLVG